MSNDKKNPQTKDNHGKIRNDEDLKRSIVHENPKPTTPPPKSREQANDNDKKK